MGLEQAKINLAHAWLAGLYSLVLYLWVRPEFTRVKQNSVANVIKLSSAKLLGRLLALPTNIRLGWKGVPGTNALAYYEKS
jgi:hypothetical protein